MTKTTLTIAGWILAASYPELAIPLSKIAGESWWLVLLRTEMLSSFWVLLSYEILSGIFWFLRRVFRTNFTINSLKRNRKKVWFTKIKPRTASWVKKIIEKAEANPYLVLFLFNLIPIIPYLTTITVVAVKFFRIRRGLFVILCGNGIKILVITLLAYKLL